MAPVIQRYRDCQRSFFTPVRPLMAPPHPGRPPRPLLAPTSVGRYLIQTTQRRLDQLRTLLFRQRGAELGVLQRTEDLSTRQLPALHRSLLPNLSWSA